MCTCIQMLYCRLPETFRCVVSALHSTEYCSTKCTGQLFQSSGARGQSDVRDVRLWHREVAADCLHQAGTKPARLQRKHQTCVWFIHEKASRLRCSRSSDLLDAPACRLLFKDKVCSFHLPSPATMATSSRSLALLFAGILLAALPATQAQLCVPVSTICTGDFYICKLVCSPVSMGD